MMIWLERFKTVIIGGLVAGIAVFLIISQPKGEFTTGTHAQLPIAEDTQVFPERTEVVESIIFVDLKGAVHQPGLYKAGEGERVFDIIQRSGGLLDSADENQINYAQKVHDEMVIYIPRIGELTDNTIITSHGAGQSAGKVDLNKADSTELETLPGIGPAKAKAIIDFREKNGPFQQIEDIQKISGFGAKTFEKLEELITVR